jgi:hypothetical protein
MSFYTDFKETTTNTKIERGSYSNAEMKESLARIRTESKGSAPISEAKGAKDMLDAAKGTSLDKYAHSMTHTEYRAEAKQSETRHCTQNKELKPFTALTADERADIEDRKSNSTSTLYVHSTISVPDVDRILLSVGLLLEQMIEDPPDGEDLFNPPPRLKSRRASTRSADRCSARDVFRFMKESFQLALWSPECNIIALVLITRLVASTEVVLNRNNWDKILMCSLMLAQKIWDDTPLSNVDFPAIWQNVYPDEVIDVAVVNRMEKLFLSLLSYDVHVSRTTYTQFYFELRDLSENEFALQPLSEEAGHNLELKGAQLQEELLTHRDKWAAQLGNGSASMKVPGKGARGGLMVFS